MAKSPAPSPAKLIKAQLLVAKAAAREKKAKKLAAKARADKENATPSSDRQKTKEYHDRVRLSIYFYVDLNVLQVVQKGHAALVRLIAEYNRGLRYLQRRPLRLIKILPLLHLAPLEALLKRSERLEDPLYCYGKVVSKMVIPQRYPA
jgi:hypothetical protein